MTILFSRVDLNKIIEHCWASYPYEACGILAGLISGEERTVTRIYSTRNMLRSATRYQIDPEEQVGVFEEIEESRLDLIGFYHSHPSFTAQPSGIDEKHAYYPEQSYVIISLIGGEAEVRSYVWRDGFLEEAVRVVE